jgi:hypothetical protein
MMQDARVVDCLVQLEEETPAEQRAFWENVLRMRVLDLKHGMMPMRAQTWYCVNKCIVPAGLQVCMNCKLTPSGMTVNKAAGQNGVAIAEVAVRESEEKNKAVELKEAGVDPMEICDSQSDKKPCEDEPHFQEDAAEMINPAAPQVASVQREEMKAEKPPRSIKRKSNLRDVPDPQPSISNKEEGIYCPKCDTMYNGERCNKCGDLLTSFKSLSKSSSISSKQLQVQSQDNLDGKLPQKWRCKFCCRMVSEDPCSICGSKRRSNL